MPEFQPFSLSRHPIARRPCARCGWDMSLTSMMPDKRDHKTRVFECPVCEHLEDAARKLK